MNTPNEKSNGNENFYKFIGREILKSEQPTDPEEIAKPNLVMLSHGFNVGDPKKPTGCVVRTTLIRGENVSSSSIYIPGGFLTENIVPSSSNPNNMVKKGLSMQVPGAIPFKSGRR